MDYLINMALSWPIGTILFVIMVIACAAAIMSVAVLLLLAGDFWFPSKKLGDGVIQKKKFTPAHSDTVYTRDIATGLRMPNTIFHGDNWSFEVQIGQKMSSISVSEAYYNERNIGDTVPLTYTKGRFIRDICIKTIG